MRLAAAASLVVFLGASAGLADAHHFATNEGQRFSCAGKFSGLADVFENINGTVAGLANKRSDFIAGFETASEKFVSKEKPALVELVYQAHFTAARARITIDLLEAQRAHDIEDLSPGTRNMNLAQQILLDLDECWQRFGPETEND